MNTMFYISATSDYIRIYRITQEMPGKKGVAKELSDEKNADVVVHVAAPMDFVLKDVVEEEIVPGKEFLAELKRIGWTNFAYYEKQKSMDFSIMRTRPMEEHDGNNLTRYVNCVRRYINSRNEVLVLDFIPNHEQKTSAHVVHETGEACLINEIRIALNGVLAKQIRGNMYELHAVNASGAPMDVMTGHITRHGDEASAAWHGDFAPTIKLGRIEPASELHISMIYMKPGRVFTNELVSVHGSEVVMPPDRTCFLHNGFTKYSQPDMLDTIKHVQLRNPLVSAPKEIRLGLYPQPYMEPRDIVIRALGQLAEDLGEIADHIRKSRTTWDDENHYAFGNVSIAIQGNELISRIYGFDESLGCVIASNAGFLDPTTCTHNSSHWDHTTKKETVIRLTAENVLELYARATDLAIDRTKSLIKQFGQA